jgi:hypothetical protein
MYINSSHIREKWKRAYHLAKSINIATSVIKKKLTTIVLQQPSESILRGLVPPSTISTDYFLSNQMRTRLEIHVYVFITNNN